MSNLDTITVAHTERGARPKHSLRTHPARLLHSPSLPNLWLPPHSGPIPQHLQHLARKSLHQPATPPAPMPSFAPQDVASDSRFPDSHTDSQRNDTRDAHSADDGTHEDDINASDQHKVSILVQKNSRQNRENTHQNILLTPPLTPSSSIRTTTSIDSVALSHVSTAPSDVSASESIENNATRFLLVGNIARHATPAQIKAAVCTALNAIDSSVFASPATVSAGNVSREVIKGLCCRLVAEAGVAMLAFFDVRVAARARQMLSMPNPLFEGCIGKDLLDTPDSNHFTCDFVSFEEVTKLSGKTSDFILQMESSFFLQVDAQTSVNNPAGDNEEDAAADYENNLAMLKSFLGSFGTLLTFELVGPQGTQSASSCSRVFSIDYYDFRDANRAFSALDGVNFFRMDLSVFRLNRALPVQHCKAPELGDDYHQDESVSFSKTSIDAPGQRSRMRERFITTDRDRLGRPRKRSLSADNTRPNDGVAAANSTAYAESPVSESLSPTTPAHRGDEAAPVFLYSSPPISPSTIRASYAGGGRGSALAPGHMYFDAAGKPLTADDRVGAHWAYYPDGNVSTAIPGEMSQPQQPPPWFVNAHAGFDTQQTPTDPRVGDDRQYYFVAPPSVPGGQTYYPAMYGASPAPGHGQMVYAGQPPSPRAIPYVQYAHPVGMGVFPHTFAPLQGTEVIFDTPVTVAPGVHYEAVPVTTSPFDPAASAAPSATEHGYMGASAPVPSTPTLSSAQQEYWVYTSGAPPPSSAHPARSSSGAQVSPRFQQRLHNNARRAHPSASTNAGTYENALHHVSQMSPDTPPPAQRDSQRASGSPIEHDVFDAHSAEGNARGGRGGGGGSGGNNKLDIERIAAGADTRTTVMIRNIPNKMTDSDLVAFIDAVCPRRIDFLYLRMDFSNSAYCCVPRSMVKMTRAFTY
ncbi:hypothetical protein HGRIS_002663 [Hohenbuehelia grisea]|uniref:Mei2-like C-terminal RNA recognition motif domain-containing protein n=1 Tax=Hohenbuehelia grisea TaxID=104357 RepID=A0ABR3JL58_9AGAR